MNNSPHPGWALLLIVFGAVLLPDVVWGEPSSYFFTGYVGFCICFLLVYHNPIVVLLDLFVAPPDQYEMPCLFLFRATIDQIDHRLGVFIATPQRLHKAFGKKVLFFLPGEETPYLLEMGEGNIILISNDPGIVFPFKKKAKEDQTISGINPLLQIEFREDFDEKQ